MTVERIDPPRMGGEREMLEGWLDYHRATLLRKCEGLTDAQMRRASCPPSKLTLLGLVRHMTDVERRWFRRGVGGEDLAFRLDYDTNPEADFEDLGCRCRRGADGLPGRVRAGPAASTPRRRWTSGSPAVAGRSASAGSCCT